MRFGGLGLRSAEAERYAAHWACLLSEPLRGTSRATTFGVGNAMLPEPVMSGRARRILLNCLPRPVRCCDMLISKFKKHSI